MWPYVIREPIEIGTYGVMMAIGFLTASWLLNKDLRRRNIDPGVGDVTIMIAIVLGVIGAKLAYLLTEAQHFTFKDFISGAGLTWHGGLILAAAGIVAYWVWKKYPIPVMLDAVAPLLASGYAFGRLGCLISGDGCYGVECSPDAALGFLCMAFPNGIVPTDPGVLVWPTPLFEALSNFALFGLLWGIRKKIRRPAIIFSIYMAWSGFSRFAIEFIRRSDDRPYRFLELRDAHLIALAQVLIAVVILVWAMYRKAPLEFDFGVLPAPAAGAEKASRKKKGR
ncbi:MAG TPA: prolipoprotein diacylglyceryl transferase [Myxococcota bacterium]|nr:prolipoprotein diacylglyceryl transferase [Myxococcota bacterium]HOD07533.1 prolipoprotein diacylglyceryl transferase [Myxococcota bacterium]HPB49844.1 prolipoprotein diacylglyceryl transferase [Myxococcota bacterium]HQP94871.1 prolipoprotein diacylglyceryl transferase [Myxococcota bacterium]